MSTSKSAKSSPAAKSTRSRDGCRECRRLHRKCGEQRPACDGCLVAGKPCSYNKPLSWGGRPFGKSPFGKVLATGVVPVTSTESGSPGSDERPPFVYSVESRTPLALADRVDIVTTSPSPPARSDSSKLNTLYVTPDWLSWLCEDHRSLIHHFTRDLTPCFSLCQIQHENFCRTFLPLALDSTHGISLLAAILLSASVHRDSIISPESDQRCAALYQTCIHHLRQSLMAEKTLVDDVYVATSLILCLADILAGGNRLGVWRVHLNGAAASLDNSISDIVCQTDFISSTRIFLRRWCRALRTVGFSSAHQVSPEFALDMGCEGSKSPAFHYIDVFDGFSTDLLPVFRDINEMAVEMRAIRDIEQQTAEIPQSITDLRSVVNNRCNRLISRVKIMSENPTSELDPLLSRSQKDDYCADFMTLNKLCHHTALLELYQRVLDQPQTDHEVQVEVKSGIRCLKHLVLTKGSTPGVAALHPIFIIGCSATTAQDRSFVMEWLEKMRLLYCMGNVPSAKLFLFELWQRNDALEAADSHIQWDKFMLEKNMDLSLY